jgi:hypothetical protein
VGGGGWGCAFVGVFACKHVCLRGHVVFMYVWPCDIIMLHNNVVYKMRGHVVIHAYYFVGFVCMLTCVCMDMW